MDASTKKAVEDYVKPLAVGLDGMTNYGDIERMVSASQRIAQGREGLDGDLLFLLAVFSGQERWISRMGHRSRTEIFLTSAGVPAPAVQALFRGLARIAGEPRTKEEAVVHDALKLEALGATGIARLLLEGYRERQDFLEMAGAIERTAGVEMTTEEGRRLAEPRRDAMRRFAEQLRAEHT